MPTDGKGDGGLNATQSDSRPWSLSEDGLTLLRGGWPMLKLSVHDKVDFPRPETWELKEVRRHVVDALRAPSVLTEASDLAIAVGFAPGVSYGGWEPVIGGCGVCEKSVSVDWERGHAPSCPSYKGPLRRLDGAPFVALTEAAKPGGELREALAATIDVIASREGAGMLDAYESGVLARARSALAALTAPPREEGGDYERGYAEGQRDASAERKWMQDKAWMDAVLMFDHYDHKASMTWLVGADEAVKKRDEWRGRIRQLAATKEAEDITALSAPTPPKEAGALRPDWDDARREAWLMLKPASADPRALFENGWALGRAHALATNPPAPTTAREALEAAKPGGAADVSTCFICGKPVVPGQRVLTDVCGETGHLECFGTDREGFVRDIDTGEPLRPDDPLPQGYVWETDEHPAPTPPKDAGALEAVDATIRAWALKLYKRGPYYRVSIADLAKLRDAIAPSALKALAEVEGERS